MFDGKAYGEQIVELVKGYCDRELKAVKADNAEMKARIAELEAREPIPGPPGEKGDRGEKGDTGENGKDGVDGKDGRDAANIKEALKDSGELVLTLEDGRLIRTGIRDGEKGADGRDGFDLDAFDIEPGDDGRTYTLKFEQGGTRHEYALTFPVPVYCGIFKEGESYVPGDIVTWGGNAWHCDKETSAKPDSGDWTLMVKKGRDGKNG